MLLIKEKRKNCKRIACSVARIASRRILYANRCTLYAEKGFTLIEILVATSILGIIGLTILTTFASGLHVFERVQTFGGSQADVLLAFEEMEKDIRNVFPLSTIAFEGDTQSMTFPADIYHTSATMLRGVTKQGFLDVVIDELIKVFESH